MILQQRPDDAKGSQEKKAAPAEPEAFQLPPFRSLSQTAVTLDAILIGVLLATRQNWPALGAIAGTVVAFAVFWSLHMISRIVPEYLIGMEAERRGGSGSTPVKNRTAALWRLAGMLILKYALLTIGMISIFQFVKDHLLPFLLAFVGAFSMTQLAIIIAASRAMRAAKPL
ncbi:hypothetical protein CCAX7_52460 [Capsulimonas corticalis]|uniref:Uncharacterized protein n=1 Tax=Capsulimonas corticalis TaxID=2219043 RepID=A0A402CP67_9BACT|nr:hypothetical protein [Capsulimonas corticalis]BDI33195.1 hypothetical protein CCAX7_52460 [Capsulimonas corticalis]